MSSLLTVSNPPQNFQHFLYHVLSSPLTFFLQPFATTNRHDDSVGFRGTAIALLLVYRQCYGKNNNCC